MRVATSDSDGRLPHSVKTPSGKRGSRRGRRRVDPTHGDIPPRLGRRKAPPMSPRMTDPLVVRSIRSALGSDAQQRG